jgi:hypothetical protein
MLRWRILWGIIAGAEFHRYAKIKDKRSLFYAFCFLVACLLALYSAGITGWPATSK